MKIKIKATVVMAIVVLCVVYGREMVERIPGLMLQDNGFIWTVNWWGGAIVAVGVLGIIIRKVKKPTVLNVFGPSLAAMFATAILLEMFIWHQEIGLEILKRTLTFRDWGIIAIVVAIFLIPIGGAEFENRIKKIQKEVEKKKKEWENRKRERREERQAAKAAKIAARK